MRMFNTVALVTALLLAGGCSPQVRHDTYPLSPGNTNEAKLDKSLRKNISLVTVTGKLKNRKFSFYAITAEKFKEALQKTLDDNQLLSDIGAYKLSVKLVSIEQKKSPLLIEPFPILVATIRYTLHDNADSVVYDKTLIASYRASADDSMLHERKIRMAMAGAVRNNLGGFIDTLSGLTPESATHAEITVNSMEYKEIPQPRRAAYNLFEVLGVIFILILTGIQ